MEKILKALNLKLSEKLILPLVFILLGLGIYFSRTDLKFYEGTYCVEDGFIEWITVCALAFGSFICFYRANVLKPFRRRRFTLGLTLMGLLFLFGLGEEISWGQRIIGFESPQFFKQYNTQMEFNLHNLKFGETKINKLVFGLILGIIVGIYFLILPVLYRKVKKVKEFIDSFAIPIPKNLHILVYILLVIGVK